MNRCIGLLNYARKTVVRFRSEVVKLRIFASRLTMVCFLTLMCGEADLFGQRNLTVIPDVDPEVERSSFVMGSGLKANLYANDSQIAKPIQMNFDARGRLWVAGSEVYPHIKPGQKANDKILILEDSDRDGTVDKSIVFADGLLIPTGVLPDEKGGCYVANSTELIHLSDTDGDGKADQKRVVLSGFGTEDTHHLLHTLGWAADGSLFMNQSIYIHSHVETPYGVRHMNGGGLWRFRPDSMQLETYCLGFVNPWGTSFDRWGQSFATDGAYGEGVNYVFPGSVFVTSPGAKRIMGGLNPGSPKHCGLEIVSGRHFPADWQGNMITNDFRANRVCRFVVEPEQAGYRSRQEEEVIRSTHMAFRPIDAKMGPDGALYIADWYNPIIQHGEVDFRDPRRDYVHGRVWRVVVEGRPLVQREDLTAMDAQALLQQLRLPEASTRLWAKRLLRQRPIPEVRQALAQAVEAAESELQKATLGGEASELALEDAEHFRLELLWAGLNVDYLDTRLLQRMLAAGNPKVRAAAVRVASDFLRQEDSVGAYIACEKAARDSHPQVRLEAVCALAKFPTQAAATQVLSVLKQPIDKNLDFAIWTAVRDLSPQWLPAAQAGRFNYGDDPSALAFALKAVESSNVVQPLLTLAKAGKVEGQQLNAVLKQIGSLADQTQLQQTVDWLVSSSFSDVEKLNRLLLLSDASKQIPAQPPVFLSEMILAVKENTANAQIEELASQLIKLCGRWNVVGAVDVVFEMAGKKTSANRLSDNYSIAAIEAVTNYATCDPPSHEKRATALLQSLASDQSNAWTNRAIAAAQLSKMDVPLSVNEIVALLSKWPTDQPVALVLSELLQQKQGQQLLAESLLQKQVVLPPEVARQAIGSVRGSAQPFDGLIAALQTSGKLTEVGWAFAGSELEEFVAEVAAKGDPASGQLIYRRKDLQCQNCHAIGGVGSVVGPDMISIGASAPVDYILQSLTHPNAKVKEGYNSKMILTIEGKIIAGMVSSFSNGVYRLRLADGSIVEVAQDDIEEISDGQSLMPKGLVDTLTKQEMVDLVSFLSQLGKATEYSIRDDITARAWQTMPWDDAAKSRLNRTSFDTVASEDPAMVWQSVLPLVSGEVPLAELATYKIHANVANTSFLRTPVVVVQEGEVAIQLSSIANVNLWVDADPTPIKSETVVVNLKPGKHWLTFAIDRDSDPKPLKVQVRPAANSNAVTKLPLQL